jgi:cell division protein ZapA (FtsZ GTPase activity inhibitor)
MTKELKKYKVTIAGESYFLVSDEAEEQVMRVASYVNDQMRLIAQSGLSDDPQRLAVLVALQSTGKMMEYSALLKVHQDSTERMIELLSDHESDIQENSVLS